jgi:outer membrane murein-binding lipoprotein Lpp
MPDVKSNEVQLGCGTLILIALIVLIFSGGTKVNDVKRNVDELTRQVIVLQGKVDALSKAIEKSQGAESVNKQ